MDEKQAREILGDWITPENNLYSFSTYLEWDKRRPSSIILESDYSAEDLEAIVWWMKKFGKTDININSFRKQKRKKIKFRGINTSPQLAYKGFLSLIWLLFKINRHCKKNNYETEWSVFLGMRWFR